MKRMGLFICHCGTNIADTVDVEELAKRFESYSGIEFSTTYKYMCSSPGQEMITDAIKEHNLDGIIVAACSPTLHELTFRKVTRKSGLNPFQCEIANVREQCSWVHKDKEKATEKALRIIRSIIEKVRLNEDLEPIKVDVTRKALVIGGGIAGMQAALDIAESGYPVILVEKEPSIGGHMAQLSETFPTLDCSQCILTPKMVEVVMHPNIILYTYAEIEVVDGYIGNFEVKIRKKARHVDMDKCTGCGTCWEKCPSRKIPSEFDVGLGYRTAIYIPFPQAVPNKPVIDRKNCLFFLKGKCGVCKTFCPKDAIDFTQEDEVITEKTGGIILATGYKLFDISRYGEYGYGKYKDVIDGLQFERLLSASGPTSGIIKRPSDGKEPKTVVFIQCVGSRDPQKGIEYCSKICCMYVAKHSMLYKHKVHDGQAYVFYMDIRSGGKYYEEFVRRAIEEDGAIYIRGRVSRIYEQNGKYVVKGADTFAGKPILIEADMVVLANAIEPQDDTHALSQKVGVSYDKYGFISEAHPKLRP
ncbi:CoB--CoM heterodisulfide reductase iron-sulfur subunit A family protein, partial [bacterium]|nr:CoB--CoM heterodisulfide reductase iron-sulfur subunit A family protein [bacterium]